MFLNKANYYQCSDMKIFMLVTSMETLKAKLHNMYILNAELEFLLSFITLYQISFVKLVYG